MFINKKKTHSNEFKNFLHHFKVKKGEEKTHYSIWSKKQNAGYAGSFNVPEKDMDDFYSTYFKCISTNKEDSFLVERHEKLSPILIDIDFRYPKTHNSRIYDKVFIQELLQLYMKRIEEYINITNETERYAFVFEKSKAVEYDEELMKDGIHIIFPYIVTEPAVQYIIRNHILQDALELIDKLNASNKINDIVDESVIEKNGWLLYGSKKPGFEMYTISEIFLTNKDSSSPIPEKLKKSNKYDDDYYLTRLLSIRGKEIPTEIQPDKKIEIESYKDKKAVKIAKKTHKKYVKQGVKMINNLSKNELKCVHELIDILSEHRSSNYQTWLETGWCLHNIDYSLLGKWIEFSKKCAKYNTEKTDSECAAKWDAMHDDGFGTGSLHYWAEKDDPINYRIIVSKYLNDYIGNSVNIPGNTKSYASYDVARVVFEMKKHCFACASWKDKLWYEFRNNRWIQTDSGMSLRKAISNQVVNEYNDAAWKLQKSSVQIGGENPLKEQYMTKAKKLTDIAFKLRTTNFKDQVMKEAAEIFHKECFFDKLDSNPNLLGFENGVYDLEKMQFRPGRSEDYISFSTKINYVKFNPKDPIFDEIMEFISQILPNKVVREYVLTLLSSTLSGHTGDEKFHIWTGSGGNGKSKIIELFELGLGDYTCKLPITVLTRKRAASNAPQPELARTKGKRFACLQEPEDDEKINVGLMKELTGGDKIIARGLNKDPIEFKPQFKLLLTCNALPRIPSNDGGTWRRLRVVEFVSEFVEEPKEPHQFKINHELNQKFPGWVEPFIWLLLNKYYKTYKLGNKELGIKPGLHDPPQVTRCTKNYRMFNDIYAEFIDENIEENAQSSLKIDEVFAVFKMWHKDTYGDMKCPTKRELKAYMERKFGKYTSKGKNKGWRGIRFIPMNDSSDDELGI